MGWLKRYRVPLVMGTPSLNSDDFILQMQDASALIDLWPQIVHPERNMLPCVNVCV